MASSAGAGGVCLEGDHACDGGNRAGMIELKTEIG
jgi:hypothetical protein